HEVTHILTADRFGAPLPPWANEAVAVLSEPPSLVERHLRCLPRYRQQGQLFSLAQLVRLQDYPEARSLGPFYAQSASLVDLLSSARGPLTFTRFVRDAQQDGYERALKRHYGWDFDELERRWQRHVFGEAACPGR